MDQTPITGPGPFAPPQERVPLRLHGPTCTRPCPGPELAHEALPRLEVYSGFFRNEEPEEFCGTAHMYRFAVMLLLLSTPALSQGTRVFYTYSEWERMSDNQRSLYIAGAIDALLMYASNIEGPKLTDHLYNCLTKANLNNLQLANNVQAYTRQHPEAQGDTVQIPLIHYLRALCGPVPQ